MRRITASCWKSFSPNTATSGRTASNSLATTVATPSKWPGRAAPSQRSRQPGDMDRGREAGRIDVARPPGIHSRSQPACSSMRASSLSLPRIALEILAGRRTAVGLTKIVATTVSARRFASSTSARCPACSAPIVGTSAILSAARQLASARVNSSLVRTVCTARRASDNLLTGRRFGARGGKDASHEPAAFHRLRQRKGRHRQVDHRGSHRDRARRLGPPRRRARPRQPPADA